MGIRLENVDYVYAAGTAEEKKALDDINLKINDGEFIGLVGHTGSGKSTLTQLLNGLEKATSGNIYYEEKNYSLCRRIDGGCGEHLRLHQPDCRKKCVCRWLDDCFLFCRLVRLIRRTLSLSGCYLSKRYDAESL